MLSLAEARSKILALAEPGEPIEVPLTEALGLVLAEPAIADVDVPPFDRASQEGYAVRAEDASAGSLLRLIVSAGGGGSVGLMEPAVEGQEAAKVRSGQPIPVGADSVVLNEHSRPDSDHSGPPLAIEVLRPTCRGQNVVHRGAWMTAGTVLSPAGTRIQSTMIPLLASQGCIHPVCHRRVRLAVLAVGDHLVSPVDAPIMNRERNASNISLVALANQNGAMAHDLGAVGESHIRPQLERALSAPVVIVLGEPDGVISKTLRALKVKSVVDGLALHPGESTTYGVIKDPKGRVTHHVFHLPIAPVAAITVFHLLVLPLIARLQGSDTPWPVTLKATLKGGHPETNDRIWAAPAQLDRDEKTGGYRFKPILPRGAADLPGFAQANALALFPPNTVGFTSGARIDVCPLGPQCASIG